MQTSDIIALIGAIFGGAGVIVAIVAILVAIYAGQRSEEDTTLMNLSSHLTVWHDELIVVVSSHNQQELDDFRRRARFQGPLKTDLIVLRRKHKYSNVVEAAEDFEEKAIAVKNHVEPLSVVNQAYVNALKAIIRAL